MNGQKLGVSSRLVSSHLPSHLEWIESNFRVCYCIASTLGFHLRYKGRFFIKSSPSFKIKKKVEKRRKK